MWFGVDTIRSSTSGFCSRQCLFDNGPLVISLLSSLSTFVSQGLWTLMSGYCPTFCMVVFAPPGIWYSEPSLSLRRPSHLVWTWGLHTRFFPSPSPGSEACQAALNHTHVLLSQSGALSPQCSDTGIPHNVPPLWVPCFPVRASAPLIGYSYARQPAVGHNVLEGRVWEKVEEAETGRNNQTVHLSAFLSSAAILAWLTTMLTAGVEEGRSRRYF